MKANGTSWRHGRAKLDMSVEEAAQRLRIRPGYLRNIESNQEAATPSVRLVYRASSLYGIEFRKLVADGDGVPDPPPDQPTQPAKKQGREEKAGTGPKRVQSQNSAGAA